MNSLPHGASLDTRLRTMRIIWGAYLACVGLFVLVGRFARAGAGVRGEGGVPPMLYVFGAAGLASVVASFVVRRVFYGRAAEARVPALLQTGFIVAMALCEACVLFGLTGLFATGCDYAYLLFGLGALGMVLHFPTRAQVRAGYYRSGL